ncbi:PTS sugar transporter subunit IIA [Sporolactobacillus sp. KGMB 08714]|uniref:PTS sugar transporter subunit IIA n=1 Tax=Sporolactobacillus sp. KGMB 08714 TaxID=3064704 RepID=UPI002FBE3C3C
MIGFVIATHGIFSNGIIDAINLIMGKQENVKCLNLNHGDNIDEFGKKIQNAIIECNQNNEGVVIFTDLFGASPYNQSVQCYKKVGAIKYKLITGLNLPMLIEAFAARMSGGDLEAVKNAALSAGQSGIKEFFDELTKVK